jgi:uncharacterized membrane protein
MAGNLVYLALIVLVPFSSDLLGKYGDESVAPMVYATILGLAALVNWMMVRYSLAADHVSATARAETQPFAGRAALITPAIFLASVPLALLSPTAAELMWLTTVVGIHRLRRAARPER